MKTITVFLLLGSFSLTASASEDKILAGLDIKVVQDAITTGESRSNITCFNNEFLMNRGDRFHSAVVAIDNDTPNAVTTIKTHTCILEEKASEALLNEFRLAFEEKKNKAIKLAKEQYSELAVINRENNSPLKTTLKRQGIGFAQFVGAAAVEMGILWVLPANTTKWNPDKGERASAFKNNYIRAYTKPPVWDKDHWTINYVGHPYAGATYYLMMRNQNESWLSSFLFSTACSLTWEYAIESSVEQPSINDMLFTSTLGSVAGEGFHQLTKLMKKNGFNTLEKVAVTIINPTYVLRNGYKTN